MRKVSRTDSRSLVDILDRVLDKGIVIDATARVSLIGIDLVGVAAQITVASFQTHLQLYEGPRTFELGLLAVEPPQSLPPTREVAEKMDGAVAAQAKDERVDAGGPLGGAPPTADPEELGRAAFHEEPPGEEGG